MEYKVTVSDPKAGKSYQQEVKDEKARRLNGMKIGETFDGAILGLTGYTLEITGGSDKSGFPMKKGVKGSGRARILMRKGTGYRPKSKIRKKKTVRGERIDENIVQINTKTVKAGSKSIESLLGVVSKEKTEEKEEEKPAEEAKSPEEKKEEVEEKKAEEKKEEVKEEKAEKSKSSERAEPVKSPKEAEEKPEKKAEEKKEEKTEEKAEEKEAKPPEEKKEEKAEPPAKEAKSQDEAEPVKSPEEAEEKKEG